MDKKKYAKIIVSILILAVLGCAAGPAYMFLSKRYRQNRPVSVIFSAADLIIIPEYGADDPLRYMVADMGPPVYLPGGILAELKTEPKIKRISYQVHLGKPKSECCTYVDGPVIAFEEKSDFIVGPLVAERRHKGHLGRHELLDGAGIHDYLGLVTDILLFNNNTKIIGHLKPTGTNLDNCIFMRAKDIAAIDPAELPGYRPGDVSVIFIQLQPEINVTSFLKRLRRAHRGIEIIMI